jgi:aminomethyltransferase
MKGEGPARRLVGFALNDRAFPRQGYVLRKDGTETGSVTSGTFSPTLDRGIGLGYVTRADAAPGTCITVSIRNREIPATVVPLPFIAKK